MGPALLGLTMAMGRFGGQALVKSFSEITVLAVAAALSATGAFMAAMAEGVVVGLCRFRGVGIGRFGGGPDGVSYVGRHVSDRVRTAAIARISVIGYAGFFIGPPIMGFVSEGFGLATSFAVMGVALLLVTFILAPMLASQQGRSHAE